MAIVKIKTVRDILNFPNDAVWKPGADGYGTPRPHTFRFCIPTLQKIFKEPDLDLAYAWDGEIFTHIRDTLASHDIRMVNEGTLDYVHKFRQVYLLYK